MHEIHPTSTTSFPSPSNADIIRGLIRFLRTLKHRRSYFIAALVVASLLGGMYYSTAPRIYQATAALMVLQTGGEVWDPSMARDNSAQELIPTFEKLFHESVVVERALRKIRALPAIMRVDFAPHPVEQWPKILRENLAARSIRRTKLIELSYTSLNPRAAEAVLGAVVDSYLEFMEETHRDVSVEIVTILTREQKKLAQELAVKQQQFRQLSRQAQSFGLRNHHIDGLGASKNHHDDIGGEEGQR